MHKEDIVYIYAYVVILLLSHEILSFLKYGRYYAKWNKSDKERQIPYDLTYLESKKAK